MPAKTLAALLVAVIAAAALTIAAIAALGGFGALALLLPFTLAVAWLVRRAR